MDRPAVGGTGRGEGDDVHAEGTVEEVGRTPEAANRLVGRLRGLPLGRGPEPGALA